MKNKKISTPQHLANPPTATFEGFACFLYHGNASSTKPGWTELLSTKLTGSTHTTELTFLVTCYILSEELLAPLSKVFFLQEAYRSTIKTRPRYELIAFTYDCLPENNPMPDILVDAHCDWWKYMGSAVEESDEDIKGLPAEFLYCMGVALCKLVRREVVECRKPLGQYKEVEEMLALD